MDNSPTLQKSDVAAIKTSLPLDSAGAALAGNTGTNLGAGRMGVSSGEHARHVVDRASASAHETVDRLANRASRLAAQLDEKTQRLTQAPVRAWEYSKNSVQAYPVQAVALSLATGLLLGWLAASRSAHRAAH